MTDALSHEGAAPDATLGRFFRRDIRVADDQVVVRAGPYAAIRHPSYAGNLLMLAGLGVVDPRRDALLIDRLGDPLPRVHGDHGPARAKRLVVDWRRWVPAQ